MGVDAGRWKSVWLLLSLDRIAPLWADLWLPSKHEVSLRVQLRESLSSYLTDERFFHEAEAINIEVLRAVVRSSGTPLVAFLRDWCMHVFIDGGEDRMQEALWSSICAAAATGKKDVPAWIVERCKAVTTTERHRRTELATKLQACSRRPPDLWDERILPYSHGTMKDIDTTAKLIAGQNIFVLSWRDECSDLSTEELSQMAASTQHLKEDLGMVGVEIQTPGVWVHELADFWTRE